MDDRTLRQRLDDFGIQNEVTDKDGKTWFCMKANAAHVIADHVDRIEERLAKIEGAAWRVVLYDSKPEPPPTPDEIDGRLFRECETVLLSAGHRWVRIDHAAQEMSEMLKERTEPRP